MAVSEKAAPRLMSYFASLVGVAVCGYLFYMGEKNPRLYTSNMAINHHNSYGRTYHCHECHVPGGGFILTPSCVTSSCHGELESNQSIEELIPIMLEYWAQHQKGSRTERQAMSYLKTHQNYRINDCASCHTEHRPKDKSADPNGPMSTAMRALVWPSALDVDG